MTAKRILSGVLLASLLGAATALAQDAPATSPPGPPPETQWDKKRLDRLDRDVERLENTIARMKPDKAPPNLIEPDPEVIALTARLDELTARLNDDESSMRKVNAQLDTVSIELSKSRQAEAQGRADNQALMTKIGELEGRLAVLEKAAEDAKAAQAAQATTTTTTGEAAPASSGDPAADFKAAKALMLSQDFAGAAQGFQAYLDHYPSGAQVAEAHYQMGDAYFASKDPNTAASHYYEALKGTGAKAKWAPEATVGLASSLQLTGHSKEACAAVAEFDRRYAQTAPASVKRRAAAVKTQAKCAA
jgi:TolA-binding protein